MSARQKLSEAFVLDLQEAWKSHGKEMLKHLCESDPAKLLDAICKVIPKQIEAEITHTLSAAQLSDDELADIAASGSARTAQKASRAKPIH